MASLTVSLNDSCPGFNVMAVFKGEYYSKRCILHCPTANNVPLTHSPSVIAESLVQSSYNI